MKSRIPPTRKEISRVKSIISSELETARKDERDKTVRRMVKIMCLTLHEDHHFGKNRLAQVVMSMASKINEGLEYWDSDIGDFWFCIDKTLEKYGANFYDTEDNLVFKNKDSVLSDKS